MIHKIGIGHNTPSIDLTIIVPQPKDAIIVAHRVYGDTGHKDRNKFCIPKWNIQPDEEAYQDILVQFNVLDNLFAEITFLTYDDMYNEVRCNGVAVQPEPGEDVKWTSFFLKEIGIYIHSIEELVG